MDNYEYHGYICQSGSILCRGGNPDPNDPNNPEKIKWTIIPNEACSSINDRIPGAIDVPKNCGSASSRGITVPKGTGMSKQLKTGLIIGGSVVGVALIVGLSVHFYKKAKSKSKK